MDNKQMNVETIGNLSPAEAELVGAFREDAMSFEDALASVGDEALTDEEIQAAIALVDSLQG